jgi:hypothetical protein
LAQISDLPSFVPTLKQLQSTKQTFKGYVASVQEAAKDVRSLGRFDPVTNPNGVRDINLNLYGSGGQKVGDFDLISGGTVWELKVGPSGNWTPTEFAGQIDKMVDYARQNGMTDVGFRLNAAATTGKYNIPSFQDWLAKKKALYPDINFRYLLIPDPPSIP